ncbi:hypothetical protein PAE9249_04897 [Paenibacillus sp. CECT 9249]|nr:hypothetical protein PAE9249_04897 [Paenibacillus sp. CECT 9249]
MPRTSEVGWDIILEQKCLICEHIYLTVRIQGLIHVHKERKYPIREFEFVNRVSLFYIQIRNKSEDKYRSP